MIIKYPRQKCRPGKKSDYNVWVVDEDGRDPMMCGSKPCFKESYCRLLEKQLIRK